MPGPLIRTRLSQRTARELLSYNKHTGLLTWRVNRSRTAKAGDEAGMVRADGLVTVTIKGKQWLAHRLIWLWVTGEVPGRLGFVDGDGTNLRWANIVPEYERYSRTKAAAYQRDLRRRRKIAIAQGFDPDTNR